MPTYTATIENNSISRAREITVTGSLDDAKHAALEEFGDELREYTISIFLNYQRVASRRVSGGRWMNY